MAAQKGSASYHSHNLDADMILFIQPISLQAWSPRLSPVPTQHALAEAKAKETGTMLSLQVSHHGVHRDEVRLRGNVTSEEQWRGSKTILGTFLPYQATCSTNLPNGKVSSNYRRVISRVLSAAALQAGW
jgi:hypothetical protein